MSKYLVTYDEMESSYTVTWMKQQGVGYVPGEHAREAPYHIIALQNACMAIMGNIKHINKEKVFKIKDAAMKFLNETSLENPNVPIREMNQIATETKFGGVMKHNGTVLDQEAMRVKSISTAILKLGDKMDYSGLDDELVEKATKLAKEKAKAASDTNAKRLDTLEKKLERFALNNN